MHRCSSTLAMAIYGMTKKRVTPEINAISTLLFLSVLALLVISNVKEARQESRGRRGIVRRPSALDHLRQKLAERAGLRLPGVGGLSQPRHRLPACGQRLLLGRVYRRGPDYSV